MVIRAKVTVLAGKGLRSRASFRSDLLFRIFYLCHAFVAAPTGTDASHSSAVFARCARRTIRFCFPHCRMLAPSTPPFDTPFRLSVSNQSSPSDAVERVSCVFSHG